jgi:RIO kinase 1
MQQHNRLNFQDLEDEWYEPPASIKIRKRRKLQPKRVQAEEVEQDDLENEILFTYHASHHERDWIVSALGGFIADHVIIDVLHLVRGGKEANVYCCKANPALGVNLLAAKIYRPRMFRNLKNDAMYKIGRPILDQGGKPLLDQRSQRALNKKTRIGSEMHITSWIEHEYQALRVLHQAGADVPRPISQDRNTILMEYIGEAHNPAPTLNSLTLSLVEARRLFDRLVENIRIMLSLNLIHADLSAYNVLYFKGGISIIDFPQVVDPLFNPNGYTLLERDVERICQYFSQYKIVANYGQIAARLWEDILGIEE